VSLDAYGEAAFVAQVEKLASEDRKILDQLEEGGKPLSSDDRYMCARFVKAICSEKPEYVPHFGRLASIALLTEVVEDFVKPLEPATGANLPVAGQDLVEPLDHRQGNDRHGLERPALLRVARAGRVRNRNATGTGGAARHEAEPARTTLDPGQSSH
jgi:hypothetical protein